jgi:hypothetical protein
VIRVVTVIAVVIAGAGACNNSRQETAGGFGGIWHVHTFSLTIQPNGHGVFEWPLHAGCGPPLGPCPAPNGSDAGHADFSMTSRTATTAVGSITGSNQPYVVPNGPATLTRGPNDVIKLQFASRPAIEAYSYLCGVKTDPNIVNCGA